MDSQKSNPKVTRNTNPLPGRTCCLCVAFDAGECLAGTCEELPEEFDFLFPSPPPRAEAG